MFRLGDLVVHKYGCCKDVRLVVSIDTNYYKLKMIEGGCLDGAAIYVSRKTEILYEKVGNILDKDKKNTCI